MINNTNLRIKREKAMEKVILASKKSMRLGFFPLSIGFRRGRYQCSKGPSMRKDKMKKKIAKRID